MTTEEKALALVNEIEREEGENEARQMVSRKYNLHCAHWPEAKSFQHEFAIALCIAALRAQETANAR